MLFCFVLKMPVSSFMTRAETSRSCLSQERNTETSPQTCQTTDRKFHFQYFIWAMVYLLQVSITQFWNPWLLWIDLERFSKYKCLKSVFYYQPTMNPKRKSSDKLMVSKTPQGHVLALTKYSPENITPEWLVQKASRSGPLASRATSPELLAF